MFQDEVDVHLNPKIGSMWMPRGDQAEVVTPGNNEKRHLAGSLHWRTGRLLLSAPGRRRNAELFIAHLDDLRRQLRGYRVIHVVCDNARFHDCRAIRAYLIRHTGRLVLHYLPKYAPQTNPIERVWWHLHETITRNHRCQSIDELLNEVSDWADTQQTFYLQTESFRTLYSLAACAATLPRRIHLGPHLHSASATPPRFLRCGLRPSALRRLWSRKVFSLFLRA